MHYVRLRRASSALTLKRGGNMWLISGVQTGRSNARRTLLLAHTCTSDVSTACRCAFWPRLQDLQVLWGKQASRCSESQCLGADLCGGLFDGLIRADQLPALATLHQFAPALPLDLCREAGNLCFASEPSHRDPVTSHLVSTFLRYTFHLAGVDGGPLPEGLVPFS